MKFGKIIFEEKGNDEERKHKREVNQKFFDDLMGDDIDDINNDDDELAKLLKEQEKLNKKIADLKNKKAKKESVNIPIPIKKVVNIPIPIKKVVKKVVKIPVENKIIKKKVNIPVKKDINKITYYKNGRVNRSGGKNISMIDLVKTIKHVDYNEDIFSTEHKFNSEDAIKYFDPLYIRKIQGDRKKSFRDPNDGEMKVYDKIEFINYNTKRVPIDGDTQDLIFEMANIKIKNDIKNFKIRHNTNKIGRWSVRLVYLTGDHESPHEVSEASHFSDVFIDNMFTYQNVKTKLQSRSSEFHFSSNHKLYLRTVTTMVTPLTLTVGCNDTDKNI